MKKLMVLILAVALLSPAVAFAGASTDAALGLGAFAVFNQIISGTGIFGHVYAPPVVVQPAPVFVAPPPPPPPVVIQQYYPAPVYYQYYAPPPPVVVYGRGWCPPGLARHGRCGYRHHGHDDD